MWPFFHLENKAVKGAKRGVDRTRITKKEDWEGGKAKGTDKKVN